MALDHMEANEKSLPLKVQKLMAEQLSALTMTLRVARMQRDIAIDKAYPDRNKAEVDKFKKDLDQSLVAYLEKRSQA